MRLLVLVILASPLFSASITSSTSATITCRYVKTLIDSSGGYVGNANYAEVVTTTGAVAANPICPPNTGPDPIVQVPNAVGPFTIVPSVASSSAFATAFVEFGLLGGTTYQTRFGAAVRGTAIASFDVMFADTLTLFGDGMVRFELIADGFVEGIPSCPDYGFTLGVNSDTRKAFLTEGRCWSGGPTANKVTLAYTFTNGMQIPFFVSGSALARSMDGSNLSLSARLYIQVTSGDGISPVWYESESGTRYANGTVPDANGTVPEPKTISIVGAGLLTLLLRQRRVRGRH